MGFGKTWSKTYPVIPKDNIISHELANEDSFKASFEFDHCDPPISLLLSMEYQRIWHKEHEVFEKRKKEKVLKASRSYKERKAISSRIKGKAEDDVKKVKNDIRTKLKVRKITCNEDDKKFQTKKLKKVEQNKDVGIQKDFCECKRQKPVPASQNEKTKPSSEQAAKKPEEESICCLNVKTQMEVVICFNCKKLLKPQN